MDAATIVALVSTVVAAVIAVSVPWMTFRFALRQDEGRWLREQRAELYVDMVAEAQAERAWLEYALADDTARKQMEPNFSDLRLAPVERARLGSRAAIFGSKGANQLFGQLQLAGMQALWGREVLAADERLAWARKHVGDPAYELAALVRRELGTDRIPMEPAPQPGDVTEGGQAADGSSV